MNIELDTKLCNDFPVMFANRYSDPRTTAMCWGFECGDGWYDLLYNLCNKIMTYCNATGARVPVVSQVKEKYGTLRFYIDGGDDYIWNLILEAERTSSKTCEECGLPGKIRTGGWIYVSCDQHLRNY